MSEIRTCPSCGAEQPSGSLVCAYCGSQVVPVALSFTQRDETQRLIKSLNTCMETEKVRLLRRVDLFWTAAWLAGTVLLLILWQASRLIDHGWIHLMILTVLAFPVWRIFRRFRLVNGLIRYYQTEIEPQISAFSVSCKLPRWQFDQMAANSLDDTEPLRKFMFFRSARKKGS